MNFSGSGKSTDNGLIKAFNSKPHTEYVNAHWFLTLEDARETLKNRRLHYKKNFPYSASDITHRLPCIVLMALSASHWDESRKILIPRCLNLRFSAAKDFEKTVVFP
ncbi:integrase core domain-containing protein [Ochrobactrum sp. EDr1-4]|uniref:integrase core domain-containing protein n=1 Tax=unclassified Ochrobactrum TaxID=239106 RepID=UPI003B9E807B